MIYLRRSVCFLGLYWCLWQSAALLEISPHVSAYYPAPALAIAFIGIFGVAYLPIHAIAIVISTMPQHPFWEMSDMDWWMFVRQFVVYGGTGVLINSFCRTCFPLKSINHILTFLVVAALSSLSSALFAREIFERYDVFPSDIMKDIFFSFWIGDAAGIVIVAPLMFILMDTARNDLVLSKSKRFLLDLIDRLDFGMLAVFFSVLTIFYFVRFMTHITDFEYLCLIPVIIGAARMGLLRGYLAVLFSNTIIVLLVQLVGRGDYPALDIQFFFIMSTIAAMIIGAESDARTRAEKEAQKYYTKSIHDDLTGLSNRAYFSESLRVFKAQCVREKRTGHLLYIDIDDFKVINDAYGHNVGDVALKMIAQTLKKTVRTGDVVCRISGDEFAIILTATPEREAAITVKEKIERNIAATKVKDTPQLTLSVSIGVQEISSAIEDSIEALIDQADIKMYTAKRSKKAGVVPT